MVLSNKTYNQYLDIMKRELIPALGCTEPIAIAFAAAKARDVLGAIPQRLAVACSGSIIKNVKGVVVPNSGGMKGIQAAASLGALGGDFTKELEVLASVTPDHIEQAKRYMADQKCSVDILTDSDPLHIIVSAYDQDDAAEVEVRYAHTNITRITRNGKVLYESAQDLEEEPAEDAYASLNIRDICIFADEVRLTDIKDILEPQIECNLKISQEGLEKNYGSSVGKMLLAVYGDDIKVRAKAMAAAGSDARMGGCKLPVVINSGSGNQGLTVSLPVIAYANELGVSQDKLLRALCISNLISIHIKHGIGVLSAFCGAVSAAGGSGAAIAYLHGENIQVISGTIINTLANVSGILCDGAKPSCAAKIASAVDAAIMSYHMAKGGHVFAPGDGIVKEDVESFIAAVTAIGRNGMHYTNLEILEIMLKDSKNPA